MTHPVGGFTLATSVDELEPISMEWFEKALEEAQRDGEEGKQQAQRLKLHPGKDASPVGLLTDP